MSPTQAFSCGICEILRTSILKISANDCFWNLFKFHQDCPFLKTYTYGSNWYIYFSFCIIIYSFVYQSSLHYYRYCYNQEQSSGGVLQKRYSYKFRKLHKKHQRERLVFHEVADLQSLTFFDKVKLYRSAASLKTSP